MARDLHSSSQQKGMMTSAIPSQWVGYLVPQNIWQIRAVLGFHAVSSVLRKIGGALQIFEGPDGAARQVLPSSGTLVIYDSTLAHEVLTTHRERHLVSGRIKPRWGRRSPCCHARWHDIVWRRVEASSCNIALRARYTSFH